MFILSPQDLLRCPGGRDCGEAQIVSYTSTHEKWDTIHHEHIGLLFSFLMKKLEQNNINFGLFSISNYPASHNLLHAALIGCTLLSRRYWSSAHLRSSQLWWSSDTTQSRLVEAHLLTLRTAYNRLAARTVRKVNKRVIRTGWFRSKCACDLLLVKYFQKNMLNISMVVCKKNKK